MSDPFEQLHDPAPAVEPAPEFRAGLRERLAQALSLPRGITPMPTEDSTTTTETTPEPGNPRPAAVPYLALADARAAIDWYEEIFGATVVGEPIAMDDGRIGHAELAIGDGVLYLCDDYPEIGVTAPRPGEAPVSLMLPVDDADAVRARAVSAGANGDRPAYDGYGSRNAWIVDPFGHRWCLISPLGQ